MRTAKFVLRIVLSLAASGFFIFLSLRHTDLRSVMAATANADPRPVLGYLAILIAVHFVKTIRWGLLLEPLGGVTFRQLNSASAIGFMLMVILPLRLGELARPLIVSRPAPGVGNPLPRSGALASCVVERMVDVLAMGVLGIVSLHMLATTGGAAEFARHASVVVTFAFGAVCVGLVVAFFVRERAVAIVRSTLRPLSARISESVAQLLDGFLRGLHLGSAGRVLGFLGLTVVYWALHVWGFWMVAGAFGLPLTMLMACTVLACQVVGIMIPAGPGMVGTSQFFTQLGVSIFIPGALAATEMAARAAAYANTIWLLQFGQQVATGLLFLGASRQVSWGELFKPRFSTPE
jgi:uncharacterized protein (TIRG00374 family)